MTNDSKPKLQLLTVQEVQERLRVSRACVYGLISTNQLSCVRIGIGRGTIRVELAELEAFIERCRNAPKRKSTVPARKSTDFKFLDADRLRNAWEQEKKEGSN